MKMCACGAEIVNVRLGKLPPRATRCRSCKEMDRPPRRVRRTPEERLERKRAYDRASRKGLTADQVTELRSTQAGRCAVCGVSPAPHRDGRDGLYIDHRHDNGAIRGMLCARCNRNVAVLDLDPEYLRALVEYSTRGRAP